MMLCLLLTYSRGCYLGILFAVALFLVLLDRRFILLGIVGLALLPVVMPASIMERFLSIGDLTDTSSSYRLLIYLGTLGMLKDYWFSGIGPGMEAFNQVYPAYAYHAVSAPHSHNLFLQLTSDTGIFGMGIFCLGSFFFVGDEDEGEQQVVPYLDEVEDGDAYDSWHGQWDDHLEEYLPDACSVYDHCFF